jgi:hypothetical protein
VEELVAAGAADSTVLEAITEAAEELATAASEVGAAAAATAEDEGA